MTTQELKDGQVCFRLPDGTHIALGEGMVYPFRGELLGQFGVKSTTFISVFIWWHRSAQAEWVVRSREQIKEATGLSFAEQLSVKRKLKVACMLDEVHDRLSHKTRYRLRYDGLEKGNPIINKPVEDCEVCAPETARRRKKSNRPGAQKVITPASEFRAPTVEVQRTGKEQDIVATATAIETPSNPQELVIKIGDECPECALGLACSEHGKPTASPDRNADGPSDEPCPECITGVCTDHSEPNGNAPLACHAHPEAKNGSTQPEGAIDAPETPPAVRKQRHKAFMEEWCNAHKVKFGPYVVTPRDGKALKAFLMGTDVADMAELCRTASLAWTAKDNRRCFHCKHSVSIAGFLKWWHEIKSELADAGLTSRGGKDWSKAEWANPQPVFDEDYQAQNRSQRSQRSLGELLHLSPE